MKFYFVVHNCKLDENIINYLYFGELFQHTVIIFEDTLL